MDVVSSKWRKQKGRMTKKKAIAREKAQLRWCSKNVTDGNVSRERATSSQYELSKPSTENTFDSSKTFIESNADISRSVQKLSFFNTNVSDISDREQNTYLLVHTSVWEKLFENFFCNECQEKSLKVKFSEQQGWAAKISVQCSKCNILVVETYSSPRIKNCDSQRPPFEINNMSVSAFVDVGGGHRMMEKFSMHMQMNAMDSKTFTKHQDILACEKKELKEEILSKSRSVVRKAHENINPSFAGEEIIDIAVSYDGTWHKRGHTSHYGIGVVIDILTGLVIDYEVLSKHCLLCVTTSHELGAESPEFDIWHKGHTSSGECCKNYDGSSPGMEVFAADLLWKRSVAKCGMRYSTVLSDGDAKTFIHLVKEAVYGNDVQIEKEECINHVAKRMGTGLRNLVQEWKKKNVNLGGRGRGTLKEINILKLTSYYRNAIVTNIPDVHKMKTAILATLHHYSSTDSEPLHNKCPPGEESWCFYNRSLAKGESPASHSTMSIQLPINVLEKMVPLYKRLASPELLARCARGATQNANESLHASIWKKCPKEKFISKKRLDVAVCNAVAEHNMGCCASEEIMNKMKRSSVSPASLTIASRRDKRRIYESERSSSRVNKSIRKKLKLTKLKEEANKEKKEGKTYSAGGF